MKWIYELFGVSRQAYYQRIKSDQRALEAEVVVAQMVKQQRKLMPRLGGKKLYFLLSNQFNEAGFKIGRDKFFSILKNQRLLVSKRKTHHITTMSKHRFFKHPNRIKNLVINRAEQVWVSDITYIKTNEGFNYLHLVTDAYSKKIMGYHLSDNLKTESTLKALEMAVSQRKFPKETLIHHSDRGFQYCNDLYTDFLYANGIQISMTEKYDPYENAIAERVNGILKDEFALDKGFQNHIQAIEEVKQAVGIYNNHRPHLSCGMLSPEMAHVSNFKLQKLW